ncbi:MAG: carboxypeptidase regulatory-like domain-containing protein, partial [Bryobacteraceae bacterium]
LCITATVLLLLGGQVYAQQLTAQIKGTVTDATGAVVPGAQVTATNHETGVATKIPSQKDGTYQFLELPVGQYTLAVTKSGFNKFQVNNIHLALNQVYTQPVVLQVGAVSQSVQVEANPAQVQTQVTQLGVVIQGRTIQDMPLNGRNWIQLQQLEPGVVASSDRMNTAYATNGSQSQQNSFMINGIASMDLPLNGPLVIPSPDAIQEFNMITSTINPEYGRNSGAIMNAIIKSGTNSFHGDAFEFYRDTFLDGRNIYQNTKPIFHQNQFGGTIGGPIWKNHTFFFLSYQGTRNRRPQDVPDTSPVYSQPQRNGYFSDLATSAGTSPYSMVGDNGATFPAGTAYGTIFSQGFIPKADMNPLAVKLMNKYVPLPNSPGNLYSFNPTETESIDQGIARIDEHLGENDTIWATAIFQTEPVLETIPFVGASVPGFPMQDLEATKQFSADWTHTLNSTTLNDFRVGFLRFNYKAVFPVTPTLPSSAGFAITPQDSSGAGLPVISVNGLFTIGFSNDGPQPRIDNTYNLEDNFSKVVGNHTLKFGFNGHRWNVDNPFLAENSGNYSFAGQGLYSTGDAGADYLLGIPDSFSQESGGYIDARTYEFYMYAQDSWKATSSLTFNYGLGYQIDTPLANRHFGGEAVNCFAPGKQSTVFPTAPMSLLFPGDTGCTKSGYHAHYDHIGPRFGFAWAPQSKSNKTFVIRGGFGVYFNRSEEELALQNLGALPFSLYSTGAASVSGYSPAFANPYQDIATGGTVPNPFPFTPPALGSKIDFSQFFPDELNVISPDFTEPYAMNFNLNVEQQLPGAMIIQVGYVGALGHHLEMTYEGNPISPAGTAACAIDPNCVANAFQQQLYAPLHTLYGAEAPGDTFTSVGVQATDGNSNYNSLQVTLSKHLTHGLTFLANYTWAHSIDDTSSFENSGFGYRALDPFNFGADRADSTFDARQRFVFSYDWEIPHVSRIWNNWFSKEVLDGWHIAGITTLQSGFPIQLSNPDYNSLQCSAYQYYGCWDAPNVTGPPQFYDPRTSVLTNTAGPAAAGIGPQNYYYFNPNTFADEAIGQLGNAGRNAIHGPGINNTDLSLSKRFYIGQSERRMIELRLEAYNLFNHTQFSEPDTNSGGSDVIGNFNDPNFGRVLDAAPGRTIQLGAKIYF